MGRTHALRMKQEICPHFQNFSKLTRCAWICRHASYYINYIPYLLWDDGALWGCSIMMIMHNTAFLCQKLTWPRHFRIAPNRYAYCWSDNFCNLLLLNGEMRTSTVRLRDRLFHSSETTLCSISWPVEAILPVDQNYWYLAANVLSRWDGFGTNNTGTFER